MKRFIILMFACITVITANAEFYGRTASTWINSNYGWVQVPNGDNIEVLIGTKAIYIDSNSPQRLEPYSDVTDWYTDSEGFKRFTMTCRDQDGHFCNVGVVSRPDLIPYPSNYIINVILIYISYNNVQYMYVVGITDSDQGTNI